MDVRERAREVLTRLKHTYTRRGPFVTWSNPLELVVATVLSAQCTDERVNKVTKNLFKRYTTAKAYAHAKLTTLEKEIYSTGFYRIKARYLKGIGTVLEEKFRGQVPENLDNLLTLPGVSLKTAHLIMAKAFNKPTGIAVDTHVKRVAPRLGFSTAHDPEKIERDLEKLYQPKDYLAVNEFFILHGRAVCKPKPRCAICVVMNLCPSAKKFLSVRQRTS